MKKEGNILRMVAAKTWRVEEKVGIPSIAKGLGVTSICLGSVSPSRKAMG